MKTYDVFLTDVPIFSKTINTITSVFIDRECFIKKVQWVIIFSHHNSANMLINTVQNKLLFL